ncbi:helix-turn-helix transcriptional regulator [Staphylococcus ureilyticus]|uniref:helix-turn-helix transcriptional regulator n=1 Tax=Staphylococcus ureilyticus TaxID=94138 RepID=UPI0021D1DFE3|nr:helix-turn-helix domain-containing protein [Staphylococcus ureilyticus]UXS60986.1 helix-turn-helix domain-containing protein [Staphylococcus ureilyticus]
MGNIARLKVKNERDRKNLNQEEIAKLLNISLQSYCNKEKGKTNFVLSEMHTLAKFFKMSLDDLFWEEEEYENIKRIV